MIVEQPNGMDKNTFIEAIDAINSKAVIEKQFYREGRVKKFRVNWDASISPVPSEEDILAQVEVGIKRKAKNRVIAFAELIRAELIGDATPTEVMGWPAKEQRARRSQGGTATAADDTALAMEATQRGKGETPAQLVTLQLGKADLFAQAIAGIDGMQKKALDDLLTIAPADIETYLATLKTNALALKAQILGN